jgi:hypothetical protein
METTFLKKAPKLAFRLGCGLLLTVVTMSSFKAEKRFAGAYYSTADQTWTSAGAQAPNQNASNYNTIGSQTYSCSSATVGCTYDLVGGKYVFRTEGENSLN